MKTIFFKTHIFFKLKENNGIRKCFCQLSTVRASEWGIFLLHLLPPIYLIFSKLILNRYFSPETNKFSQIREKITSGNYTYYHILVMCDFCPVKKWYYKKTPLQNDSLGNILQATVLRTNASVVNYGTVPVPDCPRPLPPW